MSPYPPAFLFLLSSFHPLLSATHCHQSASVTGPAEWTRDGPVSRSPTFLIRVMAHTSPLLVDQVFLEVASSDEP